MKGLDMNDNFTFTYDASNPIYSGDTITVSTPTYEFNNTTDWSNNTSLSVDGTLTVDGVDILQSIKDIQTVLGVVSRDLQKEEKYKGLKRAAEAYQRELDKISTFEALKGSN